MIFAANFKTNHTRSSTIKYISDLSNKTTPQNKGDRILIFPPLSALDSFDCEFTIGAQNAYPVENGSFTGEIGLEQLGEFNIKTILIGHSERRELLGEDQKLISKKFSFFKEHGFEIIYCIGETLETREKGEEQVIEFLKSQLIGIDLNYDKLIIAYEPIWAIGIGKNAEIDVVKTTIDNLRDVIKSPILYGGSVSNSNINELISINGIDGVLVGTSSLSVDTFTSIILNK